MFSTFRHLISEPKRFLARLKSASRSSLSWRGKCDLFLLELLSAIAQSNLARKNDVTDFARLYITCKNDLLRLGSILFGSAS